MLSRRDLLRRAGAGAALLALGGLPAACARRSGAPSFRDPPSGLLNFANWPLYIDSVRRPDGTLVAIEAGDVTLRG